MIKLVVFAVAAICLAKSTTATYEVHFEYNEQEFTKLLLEFLPGDVSHHKVLEQAEKFKYDEALKVWNDTEALSEFWTRYDDGMLPRNAIFSLRNPIRIQEVKLFFYALYNAPTNDWFYTFAAWAHVHLNNRVFTIGFISAIIRRESTSHIVLPRPYQIFPTDYYPSQTLKVFYDERFILNSEHRNQSKWYTPIWANFSSSYERDNREYKMDYFLNSFELNSFNFWFSMMQAFWMPSSEHVNTTMRGMHWLSYKTALVNRFRMEYMSHGLKTTRDFTWRHPKVPSYMPSMVYGNGIPFTQRDELPYDSSTFVKLCDEMIALEQIIRESIAVKQIITVEGKHSHVGNTYSELGKLANIVEGNSDSLNFELYKSHVRLGEDTLGYSDRRGNNWEQFPNSLENPSTAFRDPAFYMFYLRIVNYFNELKEHLPPHPQEELVNSNLVITKFKVDKVFTFIKPYNTVIANVSVDDKIYPIQSRQMGLGHHPFKMYLTVKAIEIIPVEIRILLGPAVRYHGMSDFEYYSQFYPVYYETRDLVVGNNELVLSSADNFVGSHGLDEHFVSGEDLKKPLFTIFPRHMIFPRGTCKGMRVKYYVYINKYVPETKPELLYSWPNALQNNKPLEYPFDRRIVNMTIPNMADYYGKIFYDNDYEPTHTN